MVLVVAVCYLDHPKNLLTDWLIDWLIIDITDASNDTIDSLALD